MYIGSLLFLMVLSRKLSALRGYLHLFVYFVKMESKKRILIFDDDVHIAEIVSFLLDQNEWEVFGFRDCCDIIARIEMIKPTVIIMDNWLPVNGGVVATHILKANESSQGIPVIYLTADNQIEELAKEAKANAFLAKPFNIEDLEKLILSLS